MAYKITDACLSVDVTSNSRKRLNATECILCAKCIDECPTEAISQGDATYVIDEDKCIDCGACAGACPVGACEEA